MSLRIIDHLQSMFEPAQKAVIGDQRGRGSGIDAAGISQARNASQVARTRSWGMRPPQISCWVWAKNSISRMPPRPILMSWLSTAILAAAAISVDLALDRVNILDRRKIEMFAPNIKVELAQKPLARRRGRRPPVAP